jgi:hypothetical protein
MTAPIIPGTESTASPEDERDAMINAFEEKVRGLGANTAYYEAERRPEAIGLSVDPRHRDKLTHVGYPRLFVDSMAERQELEGFLLPGADTADEELWQWWQANNLDMEAPLGHTEAYIHGRSFITVSAPDPTLNPGWDPATPIIRVEPPTTMHAEIDSRTRAVTKAIRVIYDESGDEQTGAVLYLPDGTTGWVRVEGEWTPWFQVSHGLEMVPVVPLANRSTLSDLYGSSEITPELRSMTDAAASILMLMRNAAEIMGVPQRLMFGVKPQELGIDPETGQALFDAYMARILAFEDPEGKIAQFTAAELRNFTEALREIALQVASYTGLPPSYLATNTDNPASADAIRASESRLVKKVERKNLIFGAAWEEAMRVAYRVMKGGEVPPDYYRLESIWRDPSTPTYAAKADAAAKVYANGQGPVPRKRTWIDMGYTAAEREEMAKWVEEEKAELAMLGAIASPAAPAGAKPTSSEPKGGDVS